MRSDLQALLLALALAPLGVACTDHGHVYHDEWLDLYEVEPNDQPFQANWIGTLYPGARIAMHGSVDQVWPDVLDGFAMRSGAPIHVQFALWAEVPGADLDVCLYDPDLGQYIACWETSAHPETGAFTIYGAGKDVHLVVSSYLGDSRYQLEIRVYDACCGAAPDGIFADGSTGPHRAGSDERWARYLPVREVLGGDADRRFLPGTLLEVDLESGAIRRQPLVLERVGR